MIGLLVVLIVTSSVNTDSETSDIDGNPESPVKEKTSDKLRIPKNLFKQASAANIALRQKLSEHKEKIVETLSLNDDQKKKLQESLESLERKNVDEEEPMESIERINMENGMANELFQGDIYLSEKQANQYVAEIDGSRFKRQAYHNDTHPLKWKYPVLYYFKKHLNERAKKAFGKAARLWRISTCVDLREGKEYEEYDDEDDEEEAGEEEGVEGEDDDEEGEEEGNPEGYYDYEYVEEDDEGQEQEAKTILIVDNIKGCSSSVGRDPFYKVGDWSVQVISIARHCETIGIAAHEIAHALGFWHAQSRHDRDEHITLIEENINTFIDQFKRQTNETNNNYGLPYDYGSIMHYGATSATITKGKPTMLPKNVLYTETLGSHMLSFYDLLMMNMHYNCTARCTGDTGRCNDGFPHPRNCSNCICPSGYGGQYCNQRPRGCGEELDATADWKTLENDPYNMSTGYQNGYKKCTFWIKASEGMTVQVKIANLPDGVAVDGCIYAGVEIKAQQDQRQTGYRFCSKDDINITLTSNLSTVPVVTYMRRRRNHTGIVLEYRQTTLEGLNN